MSGNEKSSSSNCMASVGSSESTKKKLSAIIGTCGWIMERYPLVVVAIGKQLQQN